MGFQAGLSGLNAAAKNIDVIGNNVANANTVGFKSSRAIFADVFASSLGGGGSGNVGIGTKVASVQQEFTQGNITTTNSPLDVAINGRGFFRFDDNGSAMYSRNGQMHVDDNGYIVNSDNLRLTGYTVDSLNNIVASAPVPLHLSTTDISPSATTELLGTLNLDSRSPAIAGVFNPNNAATYTNSTSSAIYDSLGNAHALTYYFVKTATPGQWDVHATVDGGAVGAVDLGAGAGNPVQLDFNSSGQLTTAQPMSGVNVTVATGAISPISMQMNWTGTTQFGSDFGVTALSQDGYTSGRLVGFDIADDGVISGRYTNGQANTLGQVVLANFANPQGLRPTGNNLWQETADSGQPIIGAPQTGSMGSLQSAAIEDSNVDLTQELVNMITAQRVYQANAQTIKTQDQVLQTIVNLR
ncbi:MAG TPA: flagellar hook protein FlgE [Burkholderiales bacterium]|nr:flagellar hook protein FlgE [Burkholderiales bacterium]